MEREEFLRRFQELCLTRVSEGILENIYQVSVSTTKIYGPMEQAAALPFDFQEVEEEIRIELDLLDHEESKIVELEKFPSKSQRKKNSANSKNMDKLKKSQQTHIKNGESSTSYKPLSGQPRQLPICLRDNSSKRSGKTLPAGIILKNTFSELLVQSQFDADFEHLKKNRDKKEDQIQYLVPVNKLCKGGENKSEKRA